MVYRIDRKRLRARREKELRQQRLAMLGRTGFVAVLVSFFIRNVIILDQNLLANAAAQFLESTMSHPPVTRCAIHFYGLPRAFQALVLPSIETNIVKQNPTCDYFIQYYNATMESKGRSGAGGKVDPLEILSLKDSIHKVYPSANVQFRSTSEEEFRSLYAGAIEKVSTVNDDSGKPLYFPWRETSYVRPDTTINVLKMWHGMHTTWEIMEEYERLKPHITYDRVAILRNDVIYMTPLDVYELVPCDSPNCVHQLNQTAYIPGFSMGPVSDRSFVGPYRAAKVWAQGRFGKMDENAATMKEIDKGFGMHSEKFVLHTVFPQINQTTDVTIYEHPRLCFLRARVDLTVYNYDCNGPARWFKKSIIVNLGNSMEAVRTRIEDMTNRTCRETSQTIRSGSSVRKLPILDCSKKKARPP